MTVFWMTVYILMWPVMAAVVLALLSVGVYRDYRESKDNDEMMV